MNPDLIGIFIVILFIAIFTLILKQMRDFDEEPIELKVEVKKEKK